MRPALETHGFMTKKRTPRATIAGRSERPRDTRPARRETPPVGNDLSPAQEQFCLTYLANGFNGAAAYKAAYPGIEDAAARACASRLLTNANVKAYLEPRITEHWKALQMDGEEALARVALDARADLRGLFDEHGEPLPPHQWPDDLANSIEAVDLKEDGTYKVKLTSKGHARRTILEVTGKVKNPTADDAIRDLATILAEKFKG